MHIRVICQTTDSLAKQRNVCQALREARQHSDGSAVEVGGKVRSIAAGAFKGNKKLTSVTIGKNAFKNCSKLKKITISTKKLKNSTVGKNAFKGIAKKAVVKVPASKKKA